jgi:hypothetical protein
MNLRRIEILIIVFYFKNRVFSIFSKPKNFILNGEELRKQTFT